MIFRSNIQIRRRLLMAAAVLFASTACGVLYFLFLYMEGVQPAAGLVEGIVDRIMAKELLSSMELSFRIDPEGGRLEGRARAAFHLSRQSSDGLLHRFSTVLPGDLFFHLNPDLLLRRVSWGDRRLRFRRIRSGVFVDLDGPPPDDGEVVLDIVYEGRVKGRNWKSLVSDSMVLLDPGDEYYPWYGVWPCTVSVKVDLPEEFRVAAPEGMARITAGPGRAETSFVFPRPVSAFLLAAVPGESRRFSLGRGVCRLIGPADRVAERARSLESVRRFFHTRLPPPVLGDVRILECRGGVDRSFRYDDSGTGLVGARTPEEDLAFLVAYFWLGSMVDRGRPLFSRGAIAGAMALYFLQRCKGETAHRRALYALSRVAQGIVPVRGERGAGGAGAGWQRFGRDAALLDMLRRRVGDGAFDRILARVLQEASQGKTASLERWLSIAASMGGEDWDWLLREWAAKGRRLDFAVRDLEIHEHPAGKQVRFILANEGNLSPPEKVKILFVTGSDVFGKLLAVPASRTRVTEYLIDSLRSVVVDPDLQWFDENRENNVAYTEPPAYLVSPSEDNRYIAVAFDRRAGSGAYPLMILNTEKGERAVYFLDRKPSRLAWIHGHRLLVETGVSPLPSDGRREPLPRASYLVEVSTGRIRSVPAGVSLAASSSGRYLLFNEVMEEGEIRHRIKDMDRRLTRPFLNDLPYRLHWIPGTDFVKPEYSTSYRGDVEVFDPSGRKIFLFSGRAARLFKFKGFEGGLAFLREKKGVFDFFVAAGPNLTPRKLCAFDGVPEDYFVSPMGGVFYLWETMEKKGLRVCRIDPALGEREVLYEGGGEGVYPVFCRRGLLFQRSHAGEGTEGSWKDVYFLPFGQGEDEARFVTHSPAPERILALVGNQRYLYYAEELSPTWSSLSVYNRYRFFRYDFLSHENEALDFNSRLP